MSSIPKKRRTTTELVSDMIIVDLPDDCLVTILNLLDILDLVSVHSTCKRLRASAGQSFLERYKELHFAFYDDYACNLGFQLRLPHQEEYDMMTYYNMTDIKKMLSSFGNYVTALGIRSESGSTDVPIILDLAKDYCGENLKSITLEHNQIDKSQLVGLKGLLKNLDRLELHHGIKSEVFGECMSYCENLKELIITEWTSSDSLLQNIRIPNLEKFIFQVEEGFFLFNEVVEDEDEDEDVDADEDDIRNLDLARKKNVFDFLEYHSNLETIEMHELLLPTPEYLVRLTNVESLLIDLRHVKNNDFVEIDWNGLFQLKSLKYLHLYLNAELRTLFHKQLSMITSKPVSNIQTLIVEINHLKEWIDLFGTFTYNKLKKLAISFQQIPSDENGLDRETVLNSARLLNNLKLDNVKIDTSGVKLDYLKHLK